MGAYMARINFTATRIAEYKCEEGKAYTILWDTGARTLGLQATRTGNKSFVFQAKFHGKDIRKTIGSPQEWKIPDARAKANEYKVMVDQGVDPRAVAAEKKSQSEAQTAQKAAKKLLAREAWNAYLAAPHSKWGERHRIDHINQAQEGGTVPKRGKTPTRPGPLASILCLPLYDITSDTVAAWMKKESASRPTPTANSFRKLRTFIGWCTTHPTYKHAVHTDCCLVAAVRDEVPSSKTKEGDCLQKEQLQSWFFHVRQIANPVFSAYLQGLLITGARREELALLQWNDLDFQWKTMTIRDKIEGQRTIPLTPYLASLLKALPRINDWVFSSPAAKEGHIISPRKVHVQALKTAGIPLVSLHGLRRSFTTLSEWVDVPTGVAAQIIGHKPSAIAEKHYTRRPIDLLRHHHEKIESWMLEQAGIDFAEKAAA